MMKFYKVVLTKSTDGYVLVIIECDINESDLSTTTYQCEISDTIVPAQLVNSVQVVKMYDMGMNEISPKPASSLTHDYGMIKYVVGESSNKVENSIGIFGYNSLEDLKTFYQDPKVKSVVYAFDDNGGFTELHTKALSDHNITL